MKLGPDPTLLTELNEELSKSNRRSSADDFTARVVEVPVATETKTRWYELDCWEPARDLIGLAGLIAIVIGVGLWSLPAAVILSGCFLVLLSWLLGGGEK